jgi:hypothetical protein
LVLGMGLAWWAMQTGPVSPLTPVLMSNVVSPLSYTSGVPAEAPGGSNHPEEGGRSDLQGLAVHVASPPEPGVSTAQMQTEQGVDKHTVSQAGPDFEHTLHMPVTPLSAQKVRHLPTHRLTQRSGRPRGESGKPSRLRARPGTSQQAPG